MPKESDDLPPPVNHVFVDYENVHEIDPTIIGNKTVHLTLLLGSRQTKLDVTLVEQLLHQAANVELVRLKASGRNALDFTLAYYLGRAVLADPGGFFHIVSKDKGYDALIEHLRSKHVRIRRHDDFATISFSAVVKSPVATVPVPTRTVKSAATPKSPVTNLEAMEARVLTYLRKPATKRPGTRQKLISHLITHLGKKVPEPEVSELIEMMSQAGHLVINDKDAVTYHLDLA